MCCVCGAGVHGRNAEQATGRHAETVKETGDVTQRGITIQYAVSVDVITVEKGFENDGWFSRVGGRQNVLRDATFV